jgi:hypothetical protein
MGFPGPLHCRRQRRRIEQQIHKTPLIFDRKPDNFGLFDRLVRGLLSGGDDEITYAAALHFRSALHHGQRFRSNTRLNAHAAVLFSGHDKNPESLFNSPRAIVDAHDMRSCAWAVREHREDRP